MNARMMLLAASAFGFATIAAAEPAKQPPAAPPANERPVILASAEIPAVSTAAADPSTTPPSPPRKRAARVTTCRCVGTPNP